MFRKSEEWSQFIPKPAGSARTLWAHLTANIKNDLLK